eukprot:TRINITY_DN15743_c0_g4_i1.p1 TRINITY_DN15743_c0_g4~~TRINITY_DN15743_c0_g4_i1.p1  ORF type:complete len:349 (+),score=74.99 TRINITY_DN15743_c0_g4_i1:97-1143(+)
MIATFHRAEWYNRYKITTTYMESTERAVKPGDIVWAKHRGCGWWPARFTTTIARGSSSQVLARVDFLEENTHALLPMNRIALYSEHKVEDPKCKRLLRAIRTADWLVSQRESSKLNGFTDRFCVRGKAFDNDIIYNTIQEEENKELEKRAVLKDFMIRDIKGLLAILTARKNIKLIYNSADAFLIAIDAIQDNIKDGDLLIKAEIGKLLKNFIAMYKDDEELLELVSKASKVLEQLKNAVINEYFGEPFKEPPKKKKVEVIEVEDQPGDMCDIEGVNRVKQFINSLNKSEEVIEQVLTRKKGDVAKAKGKGRKISVKERCIKSKTFKRDTRLMIEACQQLAKVIEEVL